MSHYQNFLKNVFNTLFHNIYFSIFKKKKKSIFLAFTINKFTLREEKIDILKNFYIIISFNVQVQVVCACVKNR